MTLLRPCLINSRRRSMNARMKISLNSASRAMRERNPSPVNSRNSPGSSDTAEHEAALAGDHGHFSGELARTMLCDGVLAGKIGLHDLHGARQQDEKRHAGVAGREKHLAWLDPAQFAGAFDPGDLRRRKDRKSLGVRRQARWVLEKRTYLSPFVRGIITIRAWPRPFGFRRGSYDC